MKHLFLIICLFMAFSATAQSFAYDGSKYSPGDILQMYHVKGSIPKDVTVIETRAQYDARVKMDSSILPSKLPLLNIEKMLAVFDVLNDPLKTTCKNYYLIKVNKLRERDLTKSDDDIFLEAMAETLKMIQDLTR